MEKKQDYMAYKLCLNIIAVRYPIVISTMWLLFSRLGANSGMYVFHTFSYRLSAKKLQMY